MITDNFILIGQKLYEPNTLTWGLNVYVITEVSLPMVSFIPHGDFRKNKGRGEAGARTHKDNLRGMFISKDEAFHELCDLWKAQIEKQFPEYSVDIFPVLKVA